MDVQELITSLLGYKDRVIPILSKVEAIRAMDARTKLCDVIGYIRLVN